MPATFGNWRDAMRAPQQNAFPSGTGFPTQNAQGGWQMPRQAPMAQPTKPMAPVAPPQTMAPPMFGQRPFGLIGMGGPGITYANMNDPQMHFGFGAGGHAGFGGAGPGFGGFGYGGSADIGGLAY